MPGVRMRIGIDARKLHDFGIGTYVQNLLKELVRIEGDVFGPAEHDLLGVDALYPDQVGLFDSWSRCTLACRLP